MKIADFGALLNAHGIHAGSGVPCSFFTSLVNFMELDGGMSYLPATSEGEAVSIAAGYVAAGKRAFALMQNSGLGNAVNPITSMLYIYQMPVVLLVSQRGQPGIPDEPQHELMGVITEELSKLCGLETFILDPERVGEQLADTGARGVPAAWIAQQGTLEDGPKLPKKKLEIRSGQHPAAKPGVFAPELTRENALRATLPFLNHGADRPAVVSTTGKLSRELYELDDREHDKDNRFYMVGSMGCAASFGLGVARARPGRPVIVLDGDGAVLMKMGTLATIGLAAPSRLHHVVFDNGTYDTTGGQMSASPIVDFAQVALACGYRVADTVASEAALTRTLEAHLASEGPTLLRVVIEPGARKDLGRPRLTPKDVYRRFRGFLEER